MASEKGGQLNWLNLAEARNKAFFMGDDTQWFKIQNNIIAAFLHATPSEIIWQMVISFANK